MDYIEEIAGAKLSNGTVRVYVWGCPLALILVLYDHRKLLC